MPMTRNNPERPPYKMNNTFKPTHTAAPWHTDIWDYPKATPSRKELVVIGGARKIATVESNHNTYNPYGVDHDTAAANAALISAAPELLTALEAFIDWANLNTNINDDNSPRNILIAACAATAKARGV